MGNVIAPYSFTFQGGFPQGTDPESYGTSLPQVVHGALRIISGSGFGTKADNNAGSYDFLGSTHIVARATDFDNAPTAVPAANTKAGWQANCDGIYPIITSKDFNVDSVASEATLEMSGGPTVSGKWLRRRVDEDVGILFPSNSRLRNFNLWDTNEFHGQVYVSFYMFSFNAFQPGKFSRMFWTGGTIDNKNIWFAKPDVALTGRAEHSGGGTDTIFIDNITYTDQTWTRMEMLYDFDLDEIRVIQDGVVTTDVSLGYNGVYTEFLGTGGLIDYYLLGNTMDECLNSEPYYFGWAQPYMDFSHKRIELTDHATWGSETKKVIQIPTGWSDTRIDIVINQGDFDNLDGKYLHVVDVNTSIYSEAL
jgi:hypothetical protein